jgi:3-dehydroquinate synthase
MEDFQLSDEIHIASKSGDYKVVFQNNYFSHLKEFYKDGDFILLDQTINKLYPEIALNFGKSLYIVKAKESSKSYTGIIPAMEAIIQSGFRKSNRLIAIGGGITQDITSFISLVLYRGVNWIFYPTNVLSQCDSCIGSKISVNFNQFKNLLGGFHPPKIVVIDTNFLNTLGKLDIDSGLGEILHYFLVSSNKDLDLFMNKAQLVKDDINNISFLLRRSLEIKKKMIEIDEFDSGPRKIFNYGHSFGHALESALDYSIPHGIAVSYGIDLANLISVKVGHLEMNIRNQMRVACEIVFIDHPLSYIDFDKYKAAILRDKKNVGDQLGIILTKDIGNMFLEICSYDNISEIIESFFKEKLYLKPII